MKNQRLFFKNKEGIQLAANLVIPLDKTPLFYAIFAHCFTCSKNFQAVNNISRTLANLGVAVLSFDFTGLGQSEGEFEDTQFSSNIEDLLSAAEFLEREYEAPSLLIGHSLGGTAVLYASAKLESVKAVVTINSPAEPNHVLHIFKESIAEIKKKGSATVNIGGREFTIKKEFLESLEKESIGELLKNLRKSFLFVHSPQDLIVDISNARELYEAAHHPKSFISIDGSDHLVSDKNDSQYVGNIIAAWSARYLVDEERIKVANDIEGHEVRVRLSGKGYTTEVKTPTHHLIADEPEALGGDNLGPNPYDLLMASLGSCTAMTLRMYADRKNWPLKEVTVFLNHDKIHLKDIKNSKDSSAKISRFERIIQLEGDLDEKQKERMLEIANRCPVHRTLQETIKIETKIHPTNKPLT